MYIFLQTQDDTHTDMWLCGSISLKGAKVFMCNILDLWYRFEIFSFQYQPQPNEIRLMHNISSQSVLFLSVQKKKKKDNV